MVFSLNKKRDVKKSGTQKGENYTEHGKCENCKNSYAFGFPYKTHYGLCMAQLVRSEAFFPIPTQKRCKKMTFLHRILCAYLLGFLCTFALLICNTATGLTSRLTRSLAFATAAVFCTFTQIACQNRLDMFHFSGLHHSFFNSIPYFFRKVNTF